MNLYLIKSLACAIYNGTPKNFVWFIKIEQYIHVFFIQQIEDISLTS